jgi:CMP-N-acetylneuraminic acid synthetase
MDRKSVAIIPARAGSKRCPNKNIALFKGKSMVAHTIEQSLASGIFDSIIVSSDDQEVIDIANQYAVDIDNRDASLATDNAPLIALIRNIIPKYNLDDNCVVCLLLVTGPLRTIEDITKAYDLFLRTDQTESVVSVTANENPVEMSWRMADGHLEPFLPTKLITTRKQDFAQSFRYNDAVIFDLAKNFMDPDRNLFGKSPVPYIMPPERSINIDYEFQLKLVQMMGKYYE